MEATMTPRAALDEAARMLREAVVYGTSHDVHAQVWRMCDEPGGGGAEEFRADVDAICSRWTEQADALAMLATIVEAFPPRFVAEALAVACQLADSACFEGNDASRDRRDAIRDAEAAHRTPTEDAR